MRGKIGFFILATVTILLGIQVYYLKTLPSSFVRVYSTSEIKEFNKPPTKSMTVDFDGDIFDYHIPHRIEQHAFQEIKDLLQRDNPDSMRKLILIAQWVREKIQFGKHAYFAPEIKAEDLLNSASKGGLRGLCDLYSRLFAITCQSLGIPARIIELNGHVVPEAFIAEHAQWVMIDPTFGYYVKKGDKPLSVVELIRCYREGCFLSAIVFIERRDDDCLYSVEDEKKLKEIYLNGFTVVSNQNIEYHEMVDSIVRHFTLLTAKVQYLDSNSTIIGSRERMVRSSLAFTGIVCIVIIGLIVLRVR